MRRERDAKEVKEIGLVRFVPIDQSIDLNDDDGGDEETSFLHKSLFAFVQAWRISSLNEGRCDHLIKYAPRYHPYPPKYTMSPLPR